MSTLFEDEVDASAGVAQVVPERGMDRYPHGLTYVIPPALAGLRVGQRVVVPLGRGDRPAPGFVVDVQMDADAIGGRRLKTILDLDPFGGALTEPLIELAQWIAGYYCAPLGSVFATMLPAAVKKGVGRSTRVLIDLPAEPPAEEPPRLSASQKRVLQAMAQAPQRPIEIRALAELAELKTTAPIKRLVQAGMLIQQRQTTVRAAWEAIGIRPTDSFTVTDRQSRAIEAISAAVADSFGVHVLHGVTGSGKTEVYLNVIERVLAAGRSAIVLVPEIALTPQTVGRFLARFDRGIAILHSGLTAAQRHEQWAMIARGEARVAVGARSAVFAPFPPGALGVIVVDEEHDSSYKQDQSPRYHARDVAIRRAQIENAGVILGSATPSLETWYNSSHRGAFHWHELPERVPGAKLPRVEIVDIRKQQKQAAQEGDRSVRLIGPRLEMLLRHTLESGGQAMLLLNRRGYANYIACPDQTCGWVMQCEHCDVAMVYHRDRDLPRGGLVRCHHCLAEQLLPERCPTCGKRIVTFGMGTQRIEEEVLRLLPGVIDEHEMQRMDSDSMHSARDYYDVLDRFRVGQIRLLIGTQMIAKGLDFPNVRLVGVVNADTAISLPDFRSAERTFQLVSQVAGRCGRGEHPGIVVVQTFQPNHPAVQCAARHDYLGFVQSEIPQRQYAGLPPVGRMARIVVRDSDHVQATRRAEQLAEALQGFVNAMSGGDGKPAAWIKGPAPCALSRIADHYRVGIEIIAPSAATVQRLLTDLRNAGLAVSDVNTAVDVDPASLL
ncbi:MAG: primosomal protein N' [Phycisphaerales bacterium]|nr:primosomal protein N' [Phycisphaerales bacterium]